MSANSANLSVIGNNLANINTIGFKASRVSFQDLVSQSLSGTSDNPMQVGLGVSVGSVSPVFSQGSIEATADATNIAIQGNGFFVVNGAAGPSFTRAGNFSFNAQGVLSTPDGQAVQGWTATDPITGAIVTNAQPSDITIPPGVLRSPVATSVVKTQTNLNSAASVADTFTTSIQVYDALGQAHVMTGTYKNTAAGAWTVDFTLPGADVVGGTIGTPKLVATGSVKFNGTGVLDVVTMTAPATGGGTAPAIKDVGFVTPAWIDGAAANAISWDVVDANGNGSLTGYQATSATSSVTQNGSSSGMVNNISISSDGTIVAAFGAGQTVNVGQIAMASFNNSKGLVKTGSNRFAPTAASGLPNVGVAGTGGRGTLIGSALEQSNVDIAQEYTQMILAQRGYQANSKTITVSDELMQDTLQLKR